MILLTVKKRASPGDGSVFELSPRRVMLGGRDAGGVDRMRVFIPPEWSDMTVYLSLQTTGGEKVTRLLDADGETTVSRNMTTDSGKIVLFATDGSEYHAYSNGIEYCVYDHPDADGTDELPNPTALEQIAALVGADKAAAVRAANAAEESLNSVNALTAETQKNALTAAEKANAAASDAHSAEEILLLVKQAEQVCNAAKEAVSGQALTNQELEALIGGS